MERKGCSKEQILSLLVSIPKKIISLHGSENVSEFVLHELCNSGCFNLNKAAYFVDNPDFNCLKGVAGFSAAENFKDKSHWDIPEKFSKHMQTTPFNQQVRSILKPSLKNTGRSDAQATTEIAKELHLKAPLFCRWNMKNDNHGLLIYECATDSNELLKDLLSDGACLLGFCPIH